MVKGAEFVKNIQESMRDSDFEALCLKREPTRVSLKNFCEVYEFQGFHFLFFWISGCFAEDCETRLSRCEFEEFFVRFVIFGVFIFYLLFSECFANDWGSCPPEKGQG